MNVTADALVFRLTIAEAMKQATWSTDPPCKPEAIRVDGVTPSDSAPLLGPNSPFIKTIASVRAKLLVLDHGLAFASDGAKKTKPYLDAKAISDRVTAFLQRGDTVADGKTLFEKIASHGGWSTPSDRVLFVNLVGVGAATMKVTRWFSLRNTVHVVVSGQAPFAYLDGNNEVLVAGVEHLHHTASVNLVKLSKATKSTDLF